MATIDLLSDRKVHALRPRERPYKRSDGRGMYVLVNPTGAKLWRLKYRLDGKEKLAALGQFPDVDTAEARERRDVARKLVAKGSDPVEAKRAQRQARMKAAEHTFRRWSESYYDHNVMAWSESHRRDVRRILDELNSGLGDKPMTSIEPEDVEEVIGAIERRGALTYARDVRLYFRCVWRHHNQKNRKQRVADPSADIEIKKPGKVQHHPALDPSEVGGFLRKLQHCPALPLVRIATRFLLMTGVRTTELRLARWSEIDTKAKLWRIPASRMKAHREHIVPLAPRVIELLAELRQMTGECELLFPNLLNPEEPMSENAIIGNIRLNMGYAGRATGHGMRRTFSTWANEQGFHPDAIERQLAHVEHNAVRAAYNAAEHLPERKRLMAAWADFVEEAELVARQRDRRAISKPGDPRGEEATREPQANSRQWA